MVIFISQKKHVLVGEHTNLVQEAIYARVTGLLFRNRDLNLPQILSTELAAYPPSIFHPDKNMRLAIGKYIQKKRFTMEVPLLTYKWHSPDVY